MPSRWVMVGIVGFWLAMTGWFVGREVWTRYGQRPLLLDALREAALDGEVHWTIKHNHNRVGRAMTHVIPHPDTGSYEMLQDVYLENYPLPEPFHLLLGKTITLDVKSRAQVHSTGVLEQLKLEIALVGVGRLDFKGTPRGAKLHARISGQVAGIDIGPRETEVDYDARDLFLNSLCPASRMPGLRPGLRWETPIVDPTETLAEGLFPRNALPRQAVVVEVEEELAQRGPASCYDVRSRSPDMSVQIWVETKENKVLRQALEWGPTGKRTVVEIDRQKAAESRDRESGKAVSRPDREE